MPFILRYKLLDEELTVHIYPTSNNFVTVSYSLSGELCIRFPGRLTIYKSAPYYRGIYDVDSGKWKWDRDYLTLTLEIRTPDGQPFTADHVTLDDLHRFRDLRGTSHGVWTFHLHGKS